MFADVEREVGGVGGSGDLNLAESSGVVSGGGEDAAEAFDGVEVGVFEGEGAVDGGVAGFVVLPWAEVAGGVDVAYGFGVDERGFEEERLLEADIVEGEVADVEGEGELAGFVGFDGEGDVVADDLVDDEAEAGLSAAFGVVVLQRGAGLLWGDVELHALDVDVDDAHGGFEELADAGAELEVADGDHGRGVFWMRVGAVGAGEVEDAEAGTGDLEAVEEREVEGVELYGGVEAILEVGDDSLAEHGLGVVGDVFAGDEEDDEDNQDDDAEAGEPERGRLVCLFRGGAPSAGSGFSLHLLLRHVFCLSRLHALVCFDAAKQVARLLATPSKCENREDASTLRRRQTFRPKTPL